MSSRRWLREPVMTDKEIDDWLEFQAKVAPKNFTLFKIVQRMEPYITSYAGRIEAKNAEAIVKHVKQKMAATGQAEIAKQKSAVLQELPLSDLPKKIMAQQVGLPTKRDYFGKVGKSRRKTRKTHRKRTSRRR